MGLFSQDKSLDELEEEEAVVTKKRQILEQKVAIKALNERLGSGGWKAFSSNGKLSGFSPRRAMDWLKKH